MSWDGSGLGWVGVGIGWSGSGMVCDGLGVTKVTILNMFYPIGDEFGKFLTSRCDGVRHFMRN